VLLGKLELIANTLNEHVILRSALVLSLIVLILTVSIETNNNGENKNRSDKESVLKNVLTHDIS